MKRICLITPGHVASNPRLVKEANALFETGYQVRVVAGDYMPIIRPLDRALLETVPWTWHPVSYGAVLGDRCRAAWQKGLRHFARYQPLPVTLAAWTHHRLWRRLADAAAAIPADLYIGHNLAALPAAARAATQHQALLGFDAEDFHTGELPDTPEHQWEIQLRDRIERTFLPQCQHLTAASPGIATAYQQRYGVTAAVILNVFPLSEAPDSAEPDSDRPPSLYWFSQTIGPGRGLEPVIEALGQMTTRPTLYLRGHLANGYGDHLTALAERCGVTDQLNFLPPAPSQDMVQLASDHTIGLSLEETRVPNRSICLTNKIFTYLLAGVPVLMSRTSAQVALAEELGVAARVVALEGGAIAAQLDSWLTSPQTLTWVRQHAWHLGQTRFNWDVEKQQFLESIRRTRSQESIKPPVP